LENNF